MKRIVSLLVVALLVSFAITAEETVMIDFNTLKVDYTANNMAENTATMVDFGEVAGSSFTDAEKAQMKSSLAVKNWDVYLNSSARNVLTLRDSYTKPALVKKSSARFAEQEVMGIRVRFPTEAYNAYAEIRPPFEIPAYQDKDTLTNGKQEVAAADVGKGDKFNGFGVVKNVGVLKSISVWVRGLNFPHRLSVVMKNQNNVEQEYVLGYLEFDGWKQLVWENPNYVQDVRDRELNAYPLYPNSAPYMKISYFRIYKDASMVGGDFVGYIKEVKVVYDKAILQVESDIDDEATWLILQGREAARRKAELTRLGTLQVERYLEKRKMHVETPAATTPAPAATN